MHRFMQNYGQQSQDDSVLSQDNYNWDEISIGNNTMTCDRFFGVGEKKQDPDDLNCEQLTLEDTVPVEELEIMANDENRQISMIKSNSVDSDAASSSLDEGSAKTQPRKAAPSKPLATQNFKVPNVVAAGERYELRRKYREEQLLKQEREQRQFHAKPAPKFNAIHAASNQRRAGIEPKLTVPKTPKVVHTHRMYLEKKKIKLAELEEAMKPKPFVSKQPEVLHQPAFVPQLIKKTPTKVAAFNLKSDERLRERRNFDEQIKIESDRKQKEQQEKRKTEDEKIRREIRKATSFKANPNPFNS